MAASPYWKVYNPKGEYVAACKHPEDAAALIAMYGNGATIRSGHRIRDVVWTEGAESQSAAESFDFVETTVRERIC